MGNPADIAYGGCVQALAVQAAFKSVETRNDLRNFEIYSVLGNYLGPTLADRKVKLSVTELRSTRSFATRFVIASQLQNDGSERNTFSATIDFTAPNKIDNSQAGEPFTRYSRKPRMQYAAPEHLPTMHAIVANKVKEGKVRQADASYFLDTLFALGNKVNTSTLPPQALHSQNALGLDPLAESEQHSLPLTDRFSADWVKSKQDLSSPPAPPSASSPSLPASNYTDVGAPLSVTRASANACWLTFIMDGSLSFIPLTFSKMTLMDAGAVSSLDCALRFFSVPDMNDFHLREMQTVAGGDCRTYSEAFLWNRNGDLVAATTQACVLRRRVSKL